MSVCVVFISLCICVCDVCGVCVSVYASMCVCVCVVHECQCMHVFCSVCVPVYIWCLHVGVVWYVWCMCMHMYMHRHMHVMTTFGSKRTTFGGWSYLLPVNPGTLWFLRGISQATWPTFHITPLI